MFYTCTESMDICHILEPKVVPSSWHWWCKLHCFSAWCKPCPLPWRAPRTFGGKSWYQNLPVHTFLHPPSYSFDSQACSTCCPWTEWAIMSNMAGSERRTANGVFCVVGRSECGWSNKSTGQWVGCSWTSLREVGGISSQSAVFSTASPDMWWNNRYGYLWGCSQQRTVHSVFGATAGMSHLVVVRKTHWPTLKAPKLTPFPGPQSEVVLDNCAIHHDEAIRQIIEAQCSRFCPRYM